MKTVSIVTVTFNCKSVIEKTLRSVTTLDYPNFEYIVVDGASTDGTLDVINAYREKINHIVSEPDKGIYDAMNKGIALATGDYIAFLNAGDTYYEQDTLKNVFTSEIMAENPDVIYGYLIHSFSFGKFVRKRLPLTDFDKYMPIGHPATFVKTELMKKTPFDCSFRIAADYNFFYNLFKSGAIFRFVNTIVADFESENGISNSPQNAINHINEIARVNGRINTFNHQVRRLKLRTKLAIRDIIMPFMQRFFPSYMTARRVNTIECRPDFIRLKDFKI